jgi:hypothetical protein
LFESYGADFTQLVEKVADGLEREAKGLKGGE